MQKQKLNLYIKFHLFTRKFTLLVFMLHNVLFEYPLIQHDPIKRQPRQINGLVLAVNNQLHDRSANRRRMLNAVPTKSGGKHQITIVRMCAHNSILVKCVHLVVSRPGVGHLQVLKAGHAFRQHRPDVRVKIVVVHVQVITGWLLGWKGTATYNYLREINLNHSDQVNLFLTVKFSLTRNIISSQSISSEVHASWINCQWCV